MIVINTSVPIGSQSNLHYIAGQQSLIQDPEVPLASILTPWLDKLSHLHMPPGVSVS